MCYEVEGDILSHSLLELIVTRSITFAFICLCVMQVGVGVHV